MFNGQYDREKRADRYRKVAAEYAGLSKDARDPEIRSYYLRIAEEYLVRADGELRMSGREHLAALTSAADLSPLKESAA
jgi:hypothetical protein